jgi:hypothetical protein
MDGLALVDSCNDLKCCKDRFKDHLALIDWKTSNQLYIEYVLQTAAYKHSYEEETGETIEDIFIVKLGKEDGEFEAWHIDPETAELGWKAFQAALSLSRAMVLVEDAVGQMKDRRKAIEKEKKAAQKAENLKVKCKSSDRYKGTRKPVCNGGHPCETCVQKYEDAQRERQERLMELANAGEFPKIAPDTLIELQKLLDKPE